MEFLDKKGLIKMTEVEMLKEQIEELKRTVDDLKTVVSEEKSLHCYKIADNKLRKYADDEYYKIKKVKAYDGVYYENGYFIYMHVSKTAREIFINKRNLYYYPKRPNPGAYIDTEEKANEYFEIGKKIVDAYIEGLCN